MGDIKVAVIRVTADCTVESGLAIGKDALQDNFVCQSG